MDIKTIVFDLDGTLLDSNRELSDANIKAIKEIQKYGVDIIIASGRGVKNMIWIANKLNIDHIIALNGSIVYSVKEDKILFSSFLGSKIVKKVHKYCLDNVLDAVFYAKDRAFILKESPNYKKIDEYFGLDSKNYEDKYANEILKILSLYISDKDSSMSHLKNIEKLLKDHDVAIQRSSSRTVDVNSKNISKFQGLVELSKIKNIDFTKTAAFGDAGNDKKMLEGVGYPFVMANAASELQELNFEVIGDNNSLAIAKKLNSFIIKKRRKHE